jgi:cysteine synthase A
MSTIPLARERPVADPRLRALLHLVGRTPLLEITFVRHGRRRRIHAKAEHLNMTGSIKDRMAVHILARASAEGALGPGVPIVEATSGNTGIAFAAIGRALGHPVEVFMPDWMSAERRALLQALGAGLHLVSRAEGGFLGSIRQAEDWAARHPGAFLPRQFSNRENVAAHETTTGPEIARQMGAAGRPIDAFVAGVGTGGTVMGVGRFLRRVRPSVRIHPLEPASSPTLSRGHKVGVHRIQGVSDEFVPPILDLAFLDPVVSVDDGDAILMAQRLARELGLAVGISSGANFLGAVKAQDALSPDAVVVTVFPDDDRKYLSTDLFGDEPVLPRFMAPEIRLLGYDSSPA